MKSIIQPDSTYCYICREVYGKFYQEGSLERHHVMSGTANRSLSEKYGLTVMLCDQHHQHGPEAVHINRITRAYLETQAQIAFEHFNPEKSFREIFGRNVLPYRD